MGPRPGSTGRGMTRLVQARRIDDPFLDPDVHLGATIAEGLGAGLPARPSRLTAGLRDLTSQTMPGTGMGLHGRDGYAVA